MHLRTLFIAGAVVFFGAGALALRPPPEVTEVPVAAVLDSARLLRALSVLAHDSMEGRAPGTAGSTRARRYLIAELIDAGAAPIGQEYERPFRFGGSRAGINLVGMLPGEDSSAGYIVLTAHYDHMGVERDQIYNGADDNASGSAALIEIARALEFTPLQHSVIIALLDAEEAGLQGARAFVRNPPVPIAQLRLNVNLDMVARSGGLLWANGAHHTPALRPMLEAIAEDAPLRLRLGHDSPTATEGDDWTQSSDHGPFHEAGIPFIYFGVEDHSDYHRPTDDFERVDAGEYVAVVRTILATLRAADLQTLPSRQDTP